MYRECMETGRCGQNNMTMQLVLECNLSNTEDSMLEDQRRHSLALRFILDPRIAAVEHSLEATSARRAQSLLQTHLTLAGMRFDYIFIVTIVTYNVCMQPIVFALLWLQDSMTHARQHASCNSCRVQGSNPQS